MLDGDGHWADLCARLGHPELAGDPRFTDMRARERNSRACVEVLDTIFTERPREHWCAALAGFTGEWAPVQIPAEVHDDPQVRANGCITAADMGNGVSLPMVNPPASFDERPGEPSRAPEVGEHTEEVLLELGLTWDDLAELKESHAIT
jgi:crotonobetainyl-CoA:carnitine CoA-transferase CaiB-like acyl-CoA transferase